MNISELLTAETVFLPLAAASKEACIEAMIDGLRQSGSVSDKKAYMEAVLNREAGGSTGIGFGVAIPHGKSKGVAKPGLAFARLAQPIDWQSLDGAPVSMVFMIAVPEEAAGNEHLNILVALSRKLIHEDFRGQLAAVQTADELAGLLGTIV